MALCVTLATLVAALRACAYRPVPMEELGPRALAAEVGPSAVERPERLTAALEAVGRPWTGAVHVHSDASDGSGGIEEIVAAARRADLDFVVVSDHNPLAHQRPATAWHGDVLVVVAEELSTVEGHLLALGVAPHDYRLAPRARAAAADAADLGGFVLAAHPDHRRVPWRGGWGLVEGFELVSLSGAWSRAGTLAGLGILGSYPLDADYAAVRLLAERPPGLRRLDRLTALAAGAASPAAPGGAGDPASTAPGEAAGPAPGPAPGSVEAGPGPAPLPARPRPRTVVGAVDAHGEVVLSVPGYEATFRAVATLAWLHVPPGRASGLEAAAAEGMLLDAIRGGRTAVVVTAVGGLADLSFTARNAADAGRATTWATAGDMIDPAAGPWTLRVDMGYPGPYRIVLLRDGFEVAASLAEPLEHRAAEPGTYRAEIYRARGPAGAGQRGATPWVATGPLYVWPAAARGAARIHRAPPLPAPLVQRSFLAERHWGAEAAGGATSEARVISAARHWSLGMPGNGGPAREAVVVVTDAYAALAWRPEEAADLAGHGGLVIAARADPTVRVLLEVRTPGGAGESDGRSWRASVKLDATGRAVAVPWSRFDRWSAEGLVVDGEGPPPEELESVEAIFLLVTSDMLVPGGTAEIVVEELGAFGG